MTESGEGAEIVDAASARKEAANRLVLDRQTYLAGVHGTAEHAGSDPARWKPYHVVENRLWTQAVEKVFNAALESKSNSGPESPGSGILANLEEDDLPAMLIAASYLYPNFNNLEDGNASLAHQYMTRAGGIFRPRDFAIVNACIKAAVGDEEPEDLTTSQSTGEVFDYTAQKKVFIDAIWGCNHSLLLTPYLVALLGLERLIEKRAILTAAGELPRTLAEVNDCLPTDKSDEVLRKHINIQNEKFFGEDAEYARQLDTDVPELSHLFENKRYFQDKILRLRDASLIKIADLLQKTRDFSLHERTDRVGDEWVASLN